MSSAKYYLPFGTQLTSLAAAPTLSAGSPGSLGNGNYIYAVSFLTTQGESLVGDLTPATSSGGANTKFNLSAISLGPSYCYARKIYRTVANGTTLKVCGFINDNTTTTYEDTLADASLGPNLSITTNNIDPSLNINGVLNINGFIAQTIASQSVAFGSLSSGITCNGSGCKITITSMTTAVQTNSALVVTNNYVTANSCIIATINSYSGALVTNGIPLVNITGISAGKFTLNISNVLGATNALNGNITIFCQIIN